MVNISHLKRIFIKLVLIASVIGFIFLVSVIFLKSGGNMRSYIAGLEENMITMRGINILYLTENDGYVSLFSEEGYADMDNNSVAMEKVKIKYTGKSVTLDAVADNGRYELERFVTVYGNVNGVINDMRFDAGTDGIMQYDYKEGQGEVKEGVTFFQGDNSIKSNMVNFDTRNNFVLFKGDVSVDYYVSKK